MYEVVVGIDFGSSGSGFAYSFFDKHKIIHGQIYGASVDYKVPTEIILDDDNYTIQFGADCIKFLKEKGLEVGNYFKGIKMHLYENKSTIIAQNSGKELPLQLVIQKVLEKIKELAIKEISKNRPYLEKETEKIKWVVTVPAIWNEHQKSIMMKSCIEAGLINKNTDKSLFFALEPEAASLYCSINKEIDRNHFKTGEYYIVCDLGGGTGDIVAHLVGSNNYLNEISPSCGGNFGSNEIDKSIFKDIILKLFGCHDFNTFYRKYKKNNNGDDDENDKGELYNDWSEMEREIKDFKEGATIEKIEKNEKYSVNFSLFQDIFEDDVDINDLVKEYNDNIYDDNLLLSAKKNKKKWILELPYKIIYNYMKTQSNSICQIINDITSKEEIKTLIFVGGYCSNEILLKLIKDGLNKIITYLQPSNPSLAIMEGAVLFGMEPSKINIRKSKYTIGKAISNVWNDKIHSGKGEKYYNQEKKKWFCKHCFDKFIEINQSIKYEEEISHTSEIPCISKNKKVLTMLFYKTKKLNPIFIFEEGMFKIGECRIDIGKEYESYKDRKIKTIMKFGGTFIDVTAIHLKTGITVKTTLAFD